MILSFFIGIHLAVAGPKNSPIDGPGIESFYNEVLTEGFASSFWVKGESVFSDTEALTRQLAFAPEKIEAISLWTFTTYPDIRMRIRAYNYMLNDLSCYNSPGVASLLNGEERRIAFLKNPPLAELPKNAPWGKPLRSRAKMSNYAKEGKHANFLNKKALTWLACARIDPLKIHSCTDAIEKIVNFMVPVNSISGIPLIEKVIGDPSYAEGASRAAIKLMAFVDKFKKNSDTEFLKDHELFTDLTSSFEEVGFTPREAVEKTWDLLGLYGTRGTNISRLFAFTDTPAALKTLVALETVTVAAAVLDGALAGSGRLYSLPKRVSTLANYGKGYHFWMAAYLSRKLEVENGLGRGAASAVALSELGYQMFSETSGREDFFQKVIQNPSNFSGTRKTQIDLSFAFAGTQYGYFEATDQNLLTKIDVDEAVRKMVLFERPKLFTEIEKGLGGIIDPTLKDIVIWFDKVHPLTGLNEIRTQSCRQFL